MRLPKPPVAEWLAVFDDQVGLGADHLHRINRGDQVGVQRDVNQPSAGAALLLRLIVLDHTERVSGGLAHLARTDLDRGVAAQCMICRARCCFVPSGQRAKYFATSSSVHGRKPPVLMILAFSMSTVGLTSSGRSPLSLLHELTQCAKIVALSVGCRELLMKP
ncbi:hypothetical protein [Bradyrhizobium sp. SZCCHNRI1073]|uniref:hypothetical protein n=1 Tax=Bradyrhizobium sp. SZCCHNRI1073 TaxID=3057280 RepID=UPI002916F80B|nr:hypothetical protein [Bradyrhizobium sp. SZCCHNRI1073]